MKNEITAKQIEVPAHIGAIQNHEVRPGVKVDQDGNRYADALTKYNFLRDCLTQGIRSGNLKPINTANQCGDLISRLNEVARQCNQPEITADEAAKECAAYASGEDAHSQRVLLMEKLRSELLDGEFSVMSCRAADRGVRAQYAAWKKINVMTDAEVEAALKA